MLPKRFFVIVSGMLFMAAPFGVHATDQPSIRSTEVLGTEFRVTLSDGRMLGSEQLVGAVLTIAGPDGAPMPLRIDTVERDPTDPEIVFHTLSTQTSSGEWVNFCQPDPKGERKGFPMKGALAGDSEYRPEAPGFSITCTSGVQGKCVRWGYKPWKQAPGGASMIDLFRACMRMARADYCGDGHGYTRNGTKIDLFDKLGIQKAETENLMPFEAAWDTHGALCIRHTRISENGLVEDVIKACPRLASAPQGEACNETMPGALMFNRSK